MFDSGSNQVHMFVQSKILVQGSSFQIDCPFNVSLFNKIEFIYASYGVCSMIPFLLKVDILSKLYQAI